MLYVYQPELLCSAKALTYTPVHGMLVYGHSVQLSSGLLESWLTNCLTATNLPVTGKQSQASVETVDAPDRSIIRSECRLLCRTTKLLCLRIPDWRLWALKFEVSVYIKKHTERENFTDDTISGGMLAFGSFRLPCFPRLSAKTDFWGWVYLFLLSLLNGTPRKMEIAKFVSFAC